MGDGGGTGALFGPSETPRGLPAISSWRTRDLQGDGHPLCFSTLGSGPGGRLPPRLFLGRDLITNPAHYLRRQPARQIDSQVRPVAQQALDQAVKPAASRRDCLDQVWWRELINQETSIETFRHMDWSALKPPSGGQANRRSEAPRGSGSLRRHGRC